MIFNILRRSHPFALIDKTLLEDPALSWKAKGVLAYLLSRPPNWKARAKDLEKHSTNGKHSVWSALRELRKAGYARLDPVRDERSKKLKGSEWVIAEHPSLLLPSLGKPETRKTRDSGNRDSNNTIREITTQARRGAAPAVSGELFIGKVAKKLATYLHTQHRLNGHPPNLAKWRKQISWLLFRDLEGDRDRLKRTVKGLLSQDNDQYTPKFHNAFQFRSKFFQIESWVNRHDPPPPKETIEVINEGVRHIR